MFAWLSAYLWNRFGQDVSERAIELIALGCGAVVVGCVLLFFAWERPWISALGAVGLLASVGAYFLLRKSA